jgi:hypothetical protein
MRIDRVLLTVLLFGLLIHDGAAALDEKTCLRARLRNNRVRLVTRVVTSAEACPSGFREILDASRLEQPGPYDTVPSGQTMRGIVANDVTTSMWNGVVAYASFPVIPAAAPTDTVVVENGAISTLCGASSCLTAADLAAQAHCPGTLENPSADPGYVCVYPLWAQNVLSGTLEASAFGFSGTPPYGFKVSWALAESNRAWFEGVWVYTAP